MLKLKLTKNTYYGIRYNVMLIKVCLHRFWLHTIKFVIPGPGNDNGQSFYMVLKLGHSFTFYEINYRRKNTKRLETNFRFPFSRV